MSSEGGAGVSRAKPAEGKTFQRSSGTSGDPGEDWHSPMLLLPYASLVMF